MTEHEPYVGRAEVSEFLGVPVATLAQWTYHGVGPPSYKIGRFRKYLMSEVQAWAAAQCDREPAA